MKRNKPLQRKTPLRSDPEKVKAWKNKKYEFKARSDKRRSEESAYRGGIAAFLAAHPNCPVIAGQRTSQVHHSARRWGKWLNLKRYWIAVSHAGHAWIESNAAEAEKLGLMVRIYETYEEHVAKLLESGESLDEPIYYKTHQ